MSWFWWQLDGLSRDASMKTGDTVRFMDRRYRIGTCMTSTSIELLEMRNPLRGLWVSRDEVHAVSQSDQGDEQTPGV